jgi:hypothetical protein
VLQVQTLTTIINVLKPIIERALDSMKKKLYQTFQLEGYFSCYTQVPNLPLNSKSFRSVFESEKREVETERDDVFSFLYFLPVLTRFYRGLNDFARFVENFNIISELSYYCLLCYYS